MPTDRALVDTDLGEVALLFVGKTLALFWRLPFNVFYHWVAIPMLIHPVRTYQLPLPEAFKLIAVHRYITPS